LNNGRIAKYYKPYKRHIIYIMAKKGIGVSFGDDNIRKIDSVLSKCRHMITNEEPIPLCGLNGNVCIYGDCKREEKQHGIFFGQFESRSKFIEYCCDMVINIAESDKQSLQFVLDFIETLADNPELGPKIAFMLHELK